jgi:hypothetical protein
MAGAIDGKMKNDEKRSVSFKAIVSIPCFELWLLLHYRNVVAPISREAALQELRYPPKYDKGNEDTYAATVENLPAAVQRAAVLKQRFGRLPGADPYTDVHNLVDILRNLRNS